LNPSAKKVAITIIIILIGVIGSLWYVGYKQSRTNLSAKPAGSLMATSTGLDFDLKSYIEGRNNLEQIIVEKLAAGIASSSSVILPTKVASYTAGKIIISNDLSADNLKAYGQQIAKVLATYNLGQIDEIATTLEALEQKNPIKAQSLLAIATSDKQIISSLLKVSVPKTAATIHLNLINNLSQNAALLTDMSKILDNPYLGLQSADLYRVQKLNFYKAIDKINNFFKTDNIIFSPEEGSNLYLTN
jgi:hypothetical protein